MVGNLNSYCARVFKSVLLETTFWNTYHHYDHEWNDVWIYIYRSVVTYRTLWWCMAIFPSWGFLYNSKAEPRCSRLPAKSRDWCGGPIFAVFDYTDEIEIRNEFNDGKWLHYKLWVNISLNPFFRELLVKTGNLTVIDRCTLNMLTATVLTFIVTATWHIINTHVRWLCGWHLLTCIMTISVRTNQIKRKIC